MNSIVFRTVLVGGLLALAPFVHGLEPKGNGGHATPGSADRSTVVGRQVTLTDGEIKRIDQRAGKLTIKHGEIKNMDMPPMTMVFEVADKNMMAGLKKGEKIRFAVEDRDGKLVVTGVERR